MLSKAHKEFLAKVRKDESERIMTMELLIWQSERNIENKQAYLLVIDQRMKDKFYPSANAGREDQKETQAAITIAEQDIKRYKDQIETANESLNLYESWEQHLKFK